jgi:hypothetical protein
VWRARGATRSDRSRDERITLVPRGDPLRPARAYPRQSGSRGHDTSVILSGMSETELTDTVIREAMLRGEEAVCAGALPWRVLGHRQAMHWVLDPPAS